jgi:peroxiredoxin
MTLRNPRERNRRRIAVLVLLVLCATFLAYSIVAKRRAQAALSANNDIEAPIAAQMGKLRSLAPDVRARTTQQLALQIRQLPVSMNKVPLANSLASFSTEGDLGQDTLQQVATTLAESLLQQPQPATFSGPNPAYIELAQLVSFEHVHVTLDDPQFSAAMARLVADDASREKADFTLTDLQGKGWTLSELHGKVALVNFWATWCPPCRSEMPDLEALYQRFKNQGLVVLAISDEDAATVKPFVANFKITFPVLFDPGDKVNELFKISGIPKTFIYSRDGKLVAQAIDMRTSSQFQAMLAQAGLH